MKSRQMCYHGSSLHRWLLSADVYFPLFPFLLVRGFIFSVLTGGSVSGSAGSAFSVRRSGAWSLVLAVSCRRGRFLICNTISQKRQAQTGCRDTARIVYLHVHFAFPAFLFALGLFGLFWGFLSCHIFKLLTNICSVLEPSS